MKFIKIFIILIILVLFTSTAFACTITNPISGITCSPCDNTTKICECNINSANLDVTTGKLFNLTSCEDYTINVNLNAKTIWIKENLNMNDSNWNLVVSGTSKIGVDNSKSLDISFSNIIVMDGDKLTIKTLDTQKRENISITFKARDIEVKPQAELKIELKTNDGESGGGPSSNNWLSVDDGSNWDGKPGERSGDLYFEYIKLINYGKTDIDLMTGNAGHGGTTNEGDSSGNAKQDGGHGAESGYLNFKLNTIQNNGELKINLKTGNGGNGGHSAVDDGADEQFKGGNAGNSQKIVISPINKIENNGSFLLSAVGGNGGLGGTQRHDGTTCDEGWNGSGGNAGSIDSDLNISVLINKSNDFKINLENGKLGKVLKVDKSCDNGESKNYFGYPGKLPNINIDYLENTNNSIEIISKFNFTQTDFTLAQADGEGIENGGYMRSLSDLGIKVANININNLKNGSHLPKTINIRSEPDHPLFDNSIDITGCYIQPSQVTYTLNGGTNISATNIESISSFLPAGTSKSYRYCPHCEVIDLTDEVNRYTREYNIYSNVNGKILPGDLKIYYSNNNNYYYTKRADNLQYPVYTNVVDINSTLNDKIGMREYKLSKDKLVWYGAYQEQDRDDLAEDEHLFCYGQEYIISGKITTGSSSKDFTFPFVPLRELFNN